MEEPVRVGLVFPRSGQEVFVRLPKVTAQMVLSKAGAQESQKGSGEQHISTMSDAVVRQTGYPQ
jgi:hypothetical protein